jgi:hypothetical protein
MSVGSADLKVIEVECLWKLKPVRSPCLGPPQRYSKPQKIRCPVV